MSKSGFFLSRSHIELVGIRDFQAKQGESRRDRDGWTVWSLDILLYRSFATLKCEHNAIFLSNGLISVATCVIGCFDVFYALWLAEKIRPRFSTNQKKIKLLRTNRISFLAVFPPLRNWFHNNITSRHFATWIGSGRLQRKWQYLYFPSTRSPSPQLNDVPTEITLSRLPCNKIRGTDFFRERMKQTIGYWKSAIWEVAAHRKFIYKLIEHSHASRDLKVISRRYLTDFKHLITCFGH